MSFVMTHLIYYVLEFLDLFFWRNVAGCESYKILLLVENVSSTCVYIQYIRQNGNVAHGLWEKCPLPSFHIWQREVSGRNAHFCHSYC